MNPHYITGRGARKSGQPYCAPATLNWRDQHWWMAGWNDADMEMK